MILEGESLFNDASALLVYRLAVGAAVAGTVVGWNVLPMMLVALRVRKMPSRFRGAPPRWWGGAACAAS